MQLIFRNGKFYKLPKFIIRSIDCKDLVTVYKINYINQRCIHDTAAVWIHVNEDSLNSFNDTPDFERKLSSFFDDTTPNCKQVTDVHCLEPIVGKFKPFVDVSYHYRIVLCKNLSQFNDIKPTMEDIEVCTSEPIRTMEDVEIIKCYFGAFVISWNKLELNTKTDEQDKATR